MTTSLFDSKIIKMLKAMFLFGFLTSLIPGCKYVAQNTNNAKAKSSIYELSFISLTGEEIKLSSFKGKKIMIVNVASRCGFTPQYAELEKIQQKYKDKLQIIGFPCNQFAGQEPGDSKQIKEFCTSNYGITFPISEKINVKGNNKHPIFQWLTNKNLNGWNSQSPSWNFCKYIISEDGQLMAYLSSKVLPDSKEIESYLE